jgi:hypothetical protein
MTVDNSFTMKKFQSMEIIYVTFSQITKLPYVECDPETFDDQVYMFTEEEAAKEFAKSYVEKNTPLLTVKVLRKQMPNFYMGLYAEGVNMVIFHEGPPHRAGADLPETGHGKNEQTASSSPQPWRTAHCSLFPAGAPQTKPEKRRCRAHAAPA